jgi:murein L,D-transpeptidase YcbB/YkuD
LPKVKLKVQAGDSYAGVPRLAQLLRAVGDLPDGAAVPDKYSGPLVEAVKRFQNRHGLEADGVIGKATLAALNVPLNQRVRQLELALERWRWLPHTFSRPPIVVNLPEFDVRALDGDLRTSLEMKVVVGKALRWQTPPFSAQLEQVIFRPYWNVPRSILKNELLGEIARDRSYLIEHEYEVVTARGEVVTNGVVSDEILAKLRSGALMLRQVPGPNNALGLVKFVFPNPNDVYMHDTPSRALFARARRDFSHGCIRLEHAAEMADWVLRDEGWSSERIRAAMHGSVTLPVNLKQPIPVLILYRTAVVAESGEVHFFEDVYGQDAALDMQIRSARLTSGALGLHLHE